MKRACLAAALFACVHATTPPRADEPPPVVDLHVDLAHAVYATGARLDDPSQQVTLDKLSRGRVRWLVLPLFVEHAWEMDPARVRERYEATWHALAGAGLRGVRATFAFEGADGFADDPRAIDPWLDRGACVVGLVHDHDNALAGSSTDPSSDPPGKGLSAMGRALAERVTARGVLDVAHASEASALELVAIAKAHGALVIDSHTGMSALAPSRRNASDELARAIASTGGVVAISMHSGHVSKTPGEPASLEDVARHIEWAISIVGSEHVALGSDFDGLIEPPTGSDGEATWPALWTVLRAHGVNAEILHAVFHGNAERVLARCR